jgi:hypothetical protein
MTHRDVLICALLVAFAGSAGAAGRDPGDWYTYLVAPSGHMFRVISIGPAWVEADKHATIIVTYAADSPEVATILREAGEIAAVLGPQLQAKGHSRFTVLAKFGWNPRETFSTSVVYGVVFEMHDGRWVRKPPKEKDPEKIKEAEGLERSPEDPAFPFDRARIDAAARAAASWMKLLDEGSGDTVLASTSRAFRTQIGGSIDRWHALIAKRNTGCAVGERLELNRMQTRMGADPMTADGVVLVHYELGRAKGGRCIEQVALVNENGAWRLAGIKVESVPSAE